MLSDVSLMDLGIPHMKSQHFITSLTLCVQSNNRLSVNLETLVFFRLQGFAAITSKHSAGSYAILYEIIF